MTADSSTVTTSQLMAISPSGNVSTTSLSNPIGNTVIPDGNGAALVQIFVPAGQDQSQASTQVIDIGGSNATATISNFVGGDIVLGDQGTYFMSNGNQIVNVDEASGNELWRWQPNSGNVQIIAATAGGGVAIKNIIGNQEDVVRLDSTGTPTYDTWGTTGGSAGYGVLSNGSYWVNGQWVGVGGDPVIEMVEGDLLPDATGPWAEGGGSRHKQNSSPAPEVLTHLPSQIESQPGNDNLANPTAVQVTTRNFACFIDNAVRNGDDQYLHCTAPSDKTVRVRQEFRIRANAIAQTFLDDVRRPVQAIAFIGHSIGANFNTPSEFSYGVNFYYPLYPGKNPGNVSSWDVPYSQIGHLPESLPQECLAPNILCDIDKPYTKPLNALLPVEKNYNTVTWSPLPGGVDPVIWHYDNDLFTTQDTPGPSHSFLLVDKLVPDAKVIFIGACALQPALAKPGEKPIFLQMWDIDDARFGKAETRDRAIIVPIGNTALLADAATAWTRILFDLTKQGKRRMTVQQAVDDVNAIDSVQQFAIYGNSGIKF